MTSKEIQDINRVIAEAMGWTNIQYVSAKTVKGLLGYPPGEKKEITFGNITIPQKIPNPHDSISDAMEAVEKISGEQYDISIIKNINKKGTWVEIFLLKHETVCQGEAETPAAAISLALVEYLIAY